MKHLRYTYATSIFLAFVFAGTLCFAEQIHSGRKYEVTITNLTRGQIFSPPVVISHNYNFHLFTLGDVASAELSALAEDGLTNPLRDSIADLPSVFDYAVAAGPVEPGDSITLEVTARGGFRFISAAGMLVSTNDAFFAIRDIRVRAWGKVMAEAEAYDAGSEANSEDCSFVPGPPCGSNLHDDSMSEGYVHVHAGIHGLADLEPAVRDWRNPVAKITIRPIN